MYNKGQHGHWGTNRYLSFIKRLHEMSTILLYVQSQTLEGLGIILHVHPGQRRVIFMHRIK